MNLDLFVVIVDVRHLTSGESTLLRVLKVLLSFYMFRSASLSCDPASFFENKEAGGRKKQASESAHPIFLPCLRPLLF